MATTVKAVNSIEFQVGCFGSGDQKVIIAELNSDKNCGKTSFNPGEPVYIKVYTNVSYSDLITAITKGSMQMVGQFEENMEETIQFTDFSANASRPIKSDLKIEWYSNSLGDLKYVKNGTEIITNKKGKETNVCKSKYAGNNGSVIAEFPKDNIPLDDGGTIKYGNTQPYEVPEGATLGGHIVGGIKETYNKANQESDPYSGLKSASSSSGGWGKVAEYGIGIGKITYKTSYYSVLATVNNVGKVEAIFLYAEESESQQDSSTIISNEVVYATTEFEISDTPDLSKAKSVIIKAIDYITKETLAGAKVTIDGVYVGTTDADGKLIVGVINSGNHTIKIERDGYTPTNEDGLANDNFNLS